MMLRPNRARAISRADGDLAGSPAPAPFHPPNRLFHALPMASRAVRVHNVRRIVLAKPRLGIGLLAESLDQSLGVGFYEGAVFGAAAKPIERL